MCMIHLHSVRAHCSITVKKYNQIHSLFHPPINTNRFFLRFFALVFVVCLFHYFLERRVNGRSKLLAHLKNKQKTKKERYLKHRTRTRTLGAHRAAAWSSLADPLRLSSNPECVVIAFCIPVRFPRISLALRAKM